jgi:hypothetical protein
VTDREEQLFVLKVESSRISALRALLNFTEALQPKALEIVEAELRARKRSKEVSKIVERTPWPK